MIARRRQVKKTAFYKKLDNKKVQCQACNHFCKIIVGKIGICGVRQNIDGQLQLLTYGKVVAANVDPIEKKPFYHFLPGSVAFSVGTLGCNFHCQNCQNYNISQISGADQKSVDFGLSLLPAEIVSRAKNENCLSIAYTYNEPTIWVEFALDTMKLAKKAGLKNVWVSNGYMSNDVITKIVPYLDAINIDLKSFDNVFYQQNCGAKIAPVLKNCTKFSKRGIHLEVTTLVIPTRSDNEEMLAKLADFIFTTLGPETPWHISAFSPEISWKLKHLPETRMATLEKIRQIAIDRGLKYVYLGNLFNPKFDNTYCPKCKTLVISRLGYNVVKQSKAGHCPECNLKIFES